MVPDDTYIPELRKLAEAIHEGGAKCSVQICHTGKFSEGGVVLAPSAVNPSLFRPADYIMKEMTLAEIDKEIENFVQAARRIKKAGFDAVTIHGTHGFLPQQFMSPYTNVRTDKYGKDRMLFSVELVQRIKAELGIDFPIIFRMSGDEYLSEVGKRGYTIEDLKDVVPRLEEAGVDCLSVSAGTSEIVWITIQPCYQPRGLLLHLAEAVKKLVKAPVIGVGRINDPEVASKAIEEGKCDLVALSRALIADPEFPKKMREGRPEDINRCIACLHCLEHAGLGVECTVNAQVGREEEYRIRPVPPEKRKKVLIAGGGPGGMEAARVAKLRGHEVTLYEKSDKLGGQLLIASVAPGKEEVQNVADYLSTQLRKLNVKVVLNKEVTAEVVRKETPDVVVVAIGNSLFKPDIPGVDRDNVVVAEDVLNGKVKVGDKVVVIGGELVGCEVADFLAERGKKVTMTRRGKEMATGINPITKVLLFRRLNNGGVEMLTEVKYLEITEKGLKLIDKEKKERMIEANHIVLAAGSTPNNSLVEKLKGLTEEAIYLVGDCVAPRKLWNAIHEGAKVGRMI